MAHHYMGITVDFHICSTHLSGYGQLGKNSFIFRLTIRGNEIQLDGILKFLTFGVGKSDSDATSFVC
jgi:hypothetical protein